MSDLVTPEDFFRRYYPELGRRLNRLPLDDIAQYALDIEREMKGGEQIQLSIDRMDRRSEVKLLINFARFDRSIEYMLTTPRRGGPPTQMR